MCVCLFVRADVTESKRMIWYDLCVKQKKSIFDCALTFRLLLVHFVNEILCGHSIKSKVFETEITFHRDHIS